MTTAELELLRVKLVSQVENAKAGIAEIERTTAALKQVSDMEISIAKNEIGTAMLGAPNADSAIRRADAQYRVYMGEKDMQSTTLEKLAEEKTKLTQAIEQNELFLAMMNAQ